MHNDNIKDSAFAEKTEQAAKDLEFLTGRKFSVEVAQSSSGEIVVARTSSKRFYPPDCELLNFLGDRPPVSESVTAMLFPTSIEHSWQVAVEDAERAGLVFC